MLLEWRAERDHMPIDSFKYLPRSLTGYYKSQPITRQEPVPWTPLAKPLNESRVALVTTAGIYVKGSEPPFDAEREKREPMWGDPTFRRIRREVERLLPQAEIAGIRRSRLPIEHCSLPQFVCGADRRAWSAETAPPGSANRDRLLLRYIKDGG